MSSFGKHRKKREPLSGQKLRERAFDLLSRRDHSERELAKKLREKGAVLDEIPPLLEDLKERRFLDDARFAENFVRFRVGKAWGLLRYRQELLVRGVGKNIIDTVLQDLPEVGEEALKEKLSALVLREIRKGRPEQKIMASFLRRGFSAGPVREVLRDLMSEEEAVHEI